ncbi:MAG TPA: CxxxxCH/CxxCH domain-containing protein [Kofleriaceae bacterium]|nr:CxxxxCH/CxxCH domain-containing protein [Kofleriaceae bacterium]
MRRGAVVLAVVLTGCLGEVTDMGSPADEPAPNDEPLAGCAMACHGADSSNAPPKSISGATDTTSVGVGAHQSHMLAAPTWHRKVDCADCHVVPTDLGSPGHIDGDNKAELTFGMIAGAGSTWNGTTCTTHCHGETAWGGNKNEPQWTQVDGTQSTCGSCHGAPPPAPHPTDTNCAACHPTMEENSLVFRDPASHINGIVDLVDSATTGGCTTCHGSTTAAPPKDLAGNTARTSKGVGAHEQHLATSTWHRDVACSSCHVVPQTLNSPGHRDGDNIAEIIFDTLNPTGVYTVATTTCSNQYCHGNGRGSNGTISWLTTGPLACNACHATNGQGMSGDHSKHINGENMQCSGCHRDVVQGSTTIINALLHVDGAKQVKMAQGTYNPTTRQCSNTGCHGTKTW